MTPPPSPTTPPSPMSPSFSHPLDPGTIMDRPTPRLQVVTAFPVHSPLHSPSPPGIEHLSPLRHRRNASSMSSPYISPATEAMLYQPLTSLPTPLTPHARLHPGGPPIPNPRGVDGRQSRMDLRSPLPSPLHSPILERILELPMRISATSTPPAHTISFEPPQRTPILTRTVLSEPEDNETPWRPWTPIHTRTPAISHPPTSHPRSTIRRALSQTRSISTRKRPHSPPPHYHVTVLHSISSTLSSSNAHLLPAYTHALSYLRTPLVPLISVTTGLPHPGFPQSLLQYHLLTHDQLDSLARWYHQTDPPTEESWLYPAWIPPYTKRAASLSSFAGDAGQGGQERMGDVPLSTKRRRWGRFIGLRGCESPNGVGTERRGWEGEEEESFVERMEREWRRTLERAREEEGFREKGWTGRW